MKGINRIGTQLVYDIFNNRPYTDINDFMSKIKVNKTQMVSLIKAGAFDDLYPNNNRYDIMKLYIASVADQKKRITLQNMQMLATKNMIPQDLNFEQRLFFFNKYLKKNKQDDNYYLDNIAFKFYSENYDTEKLFNVQISNDGGIGYIKQSTWDNIYKKGMEPIRVWMKANQEEILNNLNQKLFEETWEKYATGSLSKWEMDSLGFYYHEHELANLKRDVYEIADFYKLETNDIQNVISTRDGKEIIIYNIYRIAGTVIDKDKNKSQFTLLTTDGVVTVKVWKNQFAKWDKQISERGEDGKKHVIEKSFFQRGNKLIITGIRREDNFIPKKYKNTDYPLFEKIEEMDDKGFIVKSAIERADEIEEGAAE